MHFCWNGPGLMQIAEILIFAVLKSRSRYYRDVVWGLSRIGMNVHRPVPAGMEEKISYWGWPDEWPNWNWPGEEGKPIEISVYSSCDSVQLNLNGQCTWI
jgi:beta-galactosidase